MPSRSKITFQLIINPKDKPLVLAFLALLAFLF
jgi:hypothetical protein